jgi:DNA-binding MarR family transcriptional regulator
MTTSIMDLIFQLKNKCALKTEEFQEQMHILPSEYAALTCIDARAPLSLAQFSGAVGLSTSRGSRVVDSMMKKRLIKRETGTADRRQVFVELTDKGRETKKKVGNLMLACEKRIIRQLDNGEREMLESTLKKLISLL